MSFGHEVGVTTTQRSSTDVEDLTNDLPTLGLSCVIW